MGRVRRREREEEKVGSPPLAPTLRKAHYQYKKLHQHLNYPHQTRRPLPPPPSRLAPPPSAMSTFGTLFRVTTYGESHCASVGAIIDGCPPVSTPPSPLHRNPYISRLSSIGSTMKTCVVLEGRGRSCRVTQHPCEAIGALGAQSANPFLVSSTGYAPHRRRHPAANDPPSPRTECSHHSRQSY